MTFYRCYRPHRFTDSARETVDRANQIIQEMSEQGYVLTLRQLYYQFVRCNWFPNENREYKRLGRLVTQAREAGEMDWLAIEDKQRTAYQQPSEEDPAEVLDGLEFGLMFNMWARQDHYLEVWVEKQALEGVVSRPCQRLDVTYMACKGYLSASEAWRAGLRFLMARSEGKHCHLIHLADHDPSGLNMTDDNRLRLHLFAETNHIEVRRLALNMDQVEKYDPPPNPAKETDSRSAAYVAKFGHDSWELDALEPKVLDELIMSTINEYRDEKVWERTLEEQEETRLKSGLAALKPNWDRIHKFMRDEKMI